MKFPGPESPSSSISLASVEPSGLSPEQRSALAQAADLMARGHSSEVAVQHLVENGMPKVVAKVLAKQIEKRI